MGYITIRRLMDRLTDNPNLKTLKTSSVAAYVKDMCGINNIVPILKTGFNYIEINEHKGELPLDCLEVRKVYICKDDANLHPVVYEDNSLLAAMDESIMRPGDKTEYGEWRVEGDILFTDLSTISKVEVMYRALRVDDVGFPLIPDEGSLMQATENYVKWRHYTILAESGIMADKYVTKTAQQYEWYIAQYTSKMDMLSEDEAVSVMNSWQRLVQTRNRNKRGGVFPQFMNTAVNKYKIYRHN